MESTSITKTERAECQGGVRFDWRIHHRRSARCEKRGVRSNQEYDVAEFGTDGSTRRSCSVSLA